MWFTWGITWQAGQRFRFYQERTTSELLNASDGMDVKLSVVRPGVVLLLLLAIFCCQFPETIGTIKHKNYYIRCVYSCGKDRIKCNKQCDKNIACELSRKLCGIGKHRTSEAGIYIRTRSDGKLFNVARLKAKSKIRKALIRELFLADDAALTSHLAESLQRLIDRFADACKKFGLTISIKRTNILGEDVRSTRSININEHTLEVVQDFTYLSSTITSNLSTDFEINKRIGKAFFIMSNRVWENGALPLNTRVPVYKACVLGLLLYGSATWMTCVKQEHRLNTFHLRCLRRILGIKRQVQQVCSPQRTSLAMARPRVSHGGWPNPKRHPLQ
ncbi:hypothetical protein LSAT2_024422 [Lamellibrachia satsuma]|nr:hypothetical protein LSAT2_024422 [Lamellibrachia satsuma]